MKKKEGTAYGSPSPKREESSKMLKEEFIYEILGAE